MSYAVKGLIQKEYDARFAGMTSFMVLKTIGINGVQNNKMRGELKKKNIRMMVVKNSLMRRTLDTLGLGKSGMLFDSGPCTVVFGGDNIVEVAKEIEPWLKKVKAIAIKGACIEGETLDAKQAVGVSKMPSRAELQGMVAGMALSPGARLAGAILSPGGAIAGCLKSIIEKQEKGAA